MQKKDPEIQEFSSRTYFGLPPNKYGLVDKQDLISGLSEKNIESDLPDYTTRNHIFNFDSRDCVGELSLREAQRSFAFEMATLGKISPEKFKQALTTDGLLDIDKLVQIVYELNLGLPERKSEQPYISGNKVKLRLTNILKLVTNLDVINIIIPRDIIPIYVYFPGFINNCLPLVLPNVSGPKYLNPSTLIPSSTWNSPIPETIEDFIDTSIESVSKNKLGGVYETSLRYWRSYTGPNCMPNPHTPPPYQLWNPPQDFNSNDPWPFQPIPVQGQRIPTYRARNGVIFAGYGLYDLDDFPVVEENQLSDGNKINIPLRKLILKLIVPKGQYINGISAETLIDNSAVTDFNELGIVEIPTTQTGYGDYQRFLPGPGLGMNYQPNVWREGKAAPIELACSTYNTDSGSLGPMPVPFPNFRGNVWGPYGRPGDRFQNVSLQATIDELYLNGDLENLEGNSIILPSYDPSEREYTYLDHFITLRRSNTIVKFRNFETSTNPNIRNAMRVQYDGGFGAVNVKVGTNSTTRGTPGPLDIHGLPNTQYDGNIHSFNSDVWITPRENIPKDWIEGLSGPQKPTITKDTSIDFDGWMFVWRDNFQFTGEIYVPCTAGGCGPMEYYDNELQTWQESSIYGPPRTQGFSQWSPSPVIGASNLYNIPTSNSTNYEIAVNIGWGKVLTFSLTSAGTGYSVADGVRTISTSPSNATGAGLTVDITAITTVGSTTIITGIKLRTPGNGYVVNDVVNIIQESSNNDATLLITSVTSIPDDLIPEENNFHYHDPLAVGPSVSSIVSGINQDYINGVETCTTDCPNSCTIPVGPYTFCIGEGIADVGTGENDPRPPPNPNCQGKCDFVNETSPEQEWNDDINNRTPNQRNSRDNARIRQLNSYPDRRVAYFDNGANNGFLISALINYRNFLVSSTPDTDVVVKIPQALRNSFTQSTSSILDGSNFNVPVRLNLGSTSGTLEYIEAVQGTLTSSSVYWTKHFYPPRAELQVLELEFYTRDGINIPLERTLGFVEQFNTSALLFSSSISSSLTYHSSYTTFSPNLPPFPGIITSTPSSVLISPTGNSKTLDNSFDPTLFRYTQRNISLMFRIQVYSPLNPGITDMVKKMPDAYMTQKTETFEDADGNEVELTPLASNIEDYEQ